MFCKRNILRKIFTINLTTDQNKQHQLFILFLTNEHQQCSTDTRAHNIRTFFSQRRLSNYLTWQSNTLEDNNVDTLDDYIYKILLFNFSLCQIMFIVDDIWWDDLRFVLNHTSHFHHTCDSTFQSIHFFPHASPLNMVTLTVRSLIHFTELLHVFVR